MTANIVYEHYIQNKVKVYDNFLGFINGENDLSFDKNILKNRYEIKETIYMISEIAQNHHRGPDFYNKIKRILDNFLDQIKQIYSIQEIYGLFKYNRLILVYLFEKGVLTPDQSLLNFLNLHEEKDIPFNSYYFYPEVKTINPKIGERMEKQLFTQNPELLNDFNEKRINGENDSYICELIRNDSIVEFIKYITQNSYSLSSSIPPSIFETNSYLIFKEKTSLIQYAAFYGSIQIYQYLKQNNVFFDKYIWYYAIHGNNSIMIHQIESDKLIEFDREYEIILKEAIKCHHNNLAIYIKDNFLLSKPDGESLEFFKSPISYIFRYFNFKLFPQKIEDNKLCFYYGCYYNYFSLVELLLNTGNFDINKSIKIYNKISKRFLK